MHKSIKIKTPPTHIGISCFSSSGISLLRNSLGFTCFREPVGLNI